MSDTTGQPAATDSGQPRQRSFEMREGKKRTIVELEVDEVGPALRYATTTVKQGQPYRER
jgi:single-strand DNA-binding protein